MKRIYKAVFILLAVSLFNCNTVTASQNSNYLKQLQSNPSLELLGKTFAEQVNARNVDGLVNLIEIKSMAKRIELKTGNAIPGLSQHLPNAINQSFVSSLFLTLDQGNGRASFRRVITVAGEKRALILLDFGEQGLNFFELIPNSRNRKIVDFYIHISGEKITDSMAKSATLLSADGTSSFKRLLGIDNEDEVSLKKVNQLIDLNRQGKRAEAYLLLKSFPPKIKRTRLFSSFLTMYSQFHSDEAYTNELATLDRLHGDNPELFFILMDHYFGTGQYQRAIKGLQRLNKRFGNESMIHYLTSVAQFSDNKFVEANAAIREAIQLEPDNEDLYWFKVEILLKQKAYSELILVIKKLEKDFSANFAPDNLRPIEGWSEFFDSKEYREEY